MVSHHPAKFGGYRYFGSGDDVFVVEQQDSTYSLKSVFMFCHAVIHKNPICDAMSISAIFY